MNDTILRVIFYATVIGGVYSFINMVLDLLLKIVGHFGWHTVELSSIEIFRIETAKSDLERDFRVSKILEERKLIWAKAKWNKLNRTLQIRQ